MTILQKVLGNMERQENLSQPNPAMWPRLRDEETTCWASFSFFSVKHGEEMDNFCHPSPSSPFSLRHKSCVVS